MSNDKQADNKSSNPLRRWFFDGLRSSDHKSRDQSPWWRVMCLTGVDYFSTLGYQPGIAYAAAGILSPFATLVLVLLTLFGAFPVYRVVAKKSPHGQGSISMLARLLPGWTGKTLVLILLGFAATDFIITITLSAADATAHIVQNPFVIQTGIAFLQDRIAVTLVLLSILGAIFLAGFKEAISVSVTLTVLYLVVNAVALFAGVRELIADPSAFSHWQEKLIAQSHGNWLTVLGTSLILFPKLALGMSGFETGVAVMPLVKGEPTDTEEQPTGRIRNTRKLLLCAGLIMGAFLMVSSVTTTMLIPDAAFQHGGQADGRAISFLAHRYLGDGLGTVYDISSILILWFAGASAMAGLLNLVPRYLPRYGMAPVWAAAMRPLVVFFTAVAFVVTIIFKADVDAQAGAYATGVLVLMTSAALAVTLNYLRHSVGLTFVYFLITCVFVYTSIMNMVERPEGLHIAALFILAILISSLISRAIRSLELRVNRIEFDRGAEEFIAEVAIKGTAVDLLSHRPHTASYAEKEEHTRILHRLNKNEADFIFLEVIVKDASEFIDDKLEVQGIVVDGYKVLRCEAPAAPNAIAAILMAVRDRTGKIPHAYFGWTEGNPLGYVFKYIFLGEGETAPVTREILRELEPDPVKRPRIHVA
ncbi:MAG: hypothetical protein K2W95_29790 [Candidatus Obscuribacterales bacterium]|nr:hypothetical protein [Candidatus Obscuribacterales bacterium]